MRIKVIDDKDKAKSIREAIQSNQGYCPCRLEQTPENKCMCKEFIEQDHLGLCHCGLYEKVED